MEATLNSTIKNDCMVGILYAKYAEKVKQHLNICFGQQNWQEFFFTIIYKYFKLHGQLGKIWKIQVIEKKLQSYLLVSECKRGGWKREVCVFLSLLL